MLDKLPPLVRHMVIAALGILLTWAGTKVTSLPAPLPELGALILTAASLYFTKLTKQYGTGK